ncbi:DUF4383 domain-containing protein [Allokutzneria sp. A3M-2-11 16]|uniref:DUF4383 domain-containing protein n=1 Tax=Allokutzneria sp. A3M-2-11 16 TaxID=2962043 RepID=UPI0020B7DE45|nr:DUF4383 domain-containing protein [Allokutzneria sp. A3M-2-11 16]MCP3799085.1 DUF4383 domain-containing protein [Allokutzneria sp. A3M-2-11 16]
MASTPAADVPHSSRYPWPQVTALVVGAAFFLVGLVGFTVTGFGNFFLHDHNVHLLGFSVNPLHNLVHFVIGLAGMAASTGLRATAVFGWALVIGYGAVFVFGLFAASIPEIDFMNINWADNGLHLVSAAIGLLVALGAAKIGTREGWTDPPRPGTH